MQDANNQRKETTAKTHKTSLSFYWYNIYELENW